VQLDLGYKDHWYSPFKNAAQIMSNNAQMPASVSFSTVEPISNWWSADFELFYTKLDEVKDGIYYQGQWHDGSPELLGFHASIEPIAGWKLGFNRALQMGGGPRETDISDIFKGFFNPAGNDNNTEDLSRDEELGDQLMSITSTVYFNWEMPTEIYLEYAAEDTNDHSNFKFGNESMSLGIYLPKVSDNSSLRYEFNKWNTAWYTNHLYKYGNTNKGFVFGHYGADDRNFGDAVPAIVQTINYHYFDSALSSWQLKASTQKNDRAEYSRAYSLSIMNSQKVGNFRLESSLTGGKNSFEEDFAYLSVSLLW
jgi:hypothetical protein